MNEGKILVSNAELELAHGFDERSGFDITYRATKLMWVSEQGQYQQR